MCGMNLAFEQKFGTILADPPWRFQNRTGKVASEHKRLAKYKTMTLQEIAAMPVQDICEKNSHCYLWVPVALISDGLQVLEAWDFTYKTMLIWAKKRKDGAIHGGGVGFYFRNCVEIVLFGVTNRFRTFAPGRTQVNMIETPPQGHSRKPDELYSIIEKCSPGPYLELFARRQRKGWTSWGDQLREVRDE
ncbi:MAG: S-adenosylmethionine-binding protein [Patescibacteria group bacterium]|nr:S-adenosylmethionine-binding protein [Patescibacteria group bacterium]